MLLGCHTVNYKWFCMKRLLALLLSIAICATFLHYSVIFSCASDTGFTPNFSQRDIHTLMPTINAAISDSDFLDNIVISPKLVSIGEPINAYELLDDYTISTMDFLVYPIFHNGTPIFEVIKTSGNSVHASKLFHSALADKVGKSVAIIYDEKNAYIINQSHCSLDLAVSFETPVTNRGTLNKVNIDFSQVQIDWSNFSPCTTLSEYIYSAITRGDVMFPTIMLPTGVVYQIESNLCWAASTACIGNYLASYNYTAQDVAQFLYGSTDYNYMATLSDSVDTLFDLYEVDYYHSPLISVPSDYTIYDNIDAGYPLYGRWQSTMTTYHQTVIRGISIQNNCIYVMDPEIGYVTVYKTGGEYRYVSSSGLVIRLVDYASML